METQPTPELKEWPFTHGDWTITFTVEVWTLPHDGKRSILFPAPKVAHKHKHAKQSVRWTKRGKAVKDVYTDTWKRAEATDQLCCFICAEYMPDETWEYFERCKEMTRCANL